MPGPASAGGGEGPALAQVAVASLDRPGALPAGVLRTAGGKQMKIEIVRPFAGKRAPRGRFYDIVERGRDFWLTEETDDGQVNEYQFQPPFRYGPHVLLVDYSGNVWAAGVHYLYRFDGEAVTTYTSRSSQCFDDDHIYSLSADPDGSLWIGTEGGLFLFRNGGFVEPPKKIHRTVFAMAYDADGMSPSVIG